MEHTTQEHTTPLPPEPSPEVIASLQEQLTKAEQQREELLRTVAEYDNARKRAIRDAETDRKFAHSKLAGDLLPALDNLDRAVHAAKQAGEQGSLIQGVIATQHQLLDILKRNGITCIPALGQPFDPNMHEAVQMLPTPDVPPNHVAMVLQQGFFIHDRVLRPATVIVATAPPTS